MLLHIVARGKAGRSPEAELVERYMKRLSWPSKLTELPESGGRPPPPADAMVTILLDEKGEQLSSIELARRLERWRDDGRREARFLIGGADGFGCGSFGSEGDWGAGFRSGVGAVGRPSTIGPRERSRTAG